VGVVLLSESLAAREWLAIALVIVACAGASRRPSIVQAGEHMPAESQPGGEEPQPARPLPPPPAG